MRNWLKNWIRNLKMRIAINWAEQAGFYVVRMQQRGGTNYIVDGDGNWLRIGRAPAGAKRSIKG